MNNLVKAILLSVLLPACGSAGETPLPSSNLPGGEAGTGGMTLQGASGAAGAAGSDACSTTCQAGPEGPAGPAGPAGPKGDPGTPGVAGKDGVQGPVGPQGTPGTDGLPGIQGLPGVKGDPGIQGAPGADGARGPQGIQGVAGPAGVKGADGLAGLPRTKADLYVITQPGNSNDTIAWCLNTKDIVLTGSCSTGTTHVINSFGAYNPTDATKSSWRCRGDPGAIVDATAVCIIVN